MLVDIVKMAKAPLKTPPNRLETGIKMCSTTGNRFIVVSQS